MLKVLAPGVYFEPADPGRRSIAPLRTDIAGFVGLAERGPLDRPMLIEDFEQYQTVFGGFAQGGFLPYAAKAFFDNGGVRAWFVRVAGDVYVSQSDPAIPLPTGDPYSGSIVENVTGFVSGALVTVEQDGLRRNHLLKSVDSARRLLMWERPLEPDFDPALPMRFATGPAPAAAEALDGLGQASLRFQAATIGTWGNLLCVRLGVTTPAAAVTRNVSQPLDRSGCFVDTVVGFARGALVRIFQGGNVVRECHRLVTSVDPVRRFLVWDSPLDPAFQPGDIAAQPISLESLELGVTLVEDGETVELYEGLSLVGTHPRYVESALRDSFRLRILDLQNGKDPSVLAARLSLLSGMELTLANGRDGVAGLTASNLTGDPSTETRRGLRTLELVDEVAIVAIPDANVMPTPVPEYAPRATPDRDPCADYGPQEPAPGASLIPAPRERLPEFSQEEIFAVQDALVQHCETQGDRVAILDPPLEANDDSSTGEVLAWRSRFDTGFAALYYPWLEVYEQGLSRGRIVREVPPSGHVAGLYARTDRGIGVHKAPANDVLHWTQGALLDIDEDQQGTFNPLGINCIRAFPGRGIRVYGARTLSSNPVWRYVPVRRLLLAIEEALQESMAWAVFEPNNVGLRQTVTVALTGYLNGLWKTGALAGSTASEAFFVRCDATNNPPETVAEGQLFADVGVAPTIPAEFVILRIGRSADRLEISEQEGMPS